MGFQYKIKIICALYLFSLHLFSPAGAQELEVVKKYKTYLQQVRKDSLHRMKELKSTDSGFVYELAYAGTNNFTGKKLYEQGELTYLREAPAMALKKVLAELKQQGLGLKIFDAYRPYHVTQKMWELIRDERYVANPSKGSGHNRGLSVDLTLINLKTGKEVDMGTGFDHFTDTAHHSFTALPAEVLKNRKLLKQVMEKAGFRAITTEWWHYSWPNDRNYPVLDIGFKQFRKERG